MDRDEKHDLNTFCGASMPPAAPAAMDFFSAPPTITNHAAMDFSSVPATNPGLNAAVSSSGGRGVTPPRGSGGMEGLDLNAQPSDLHFGMPMTYGERLRSASAGAVEEADVAGGLRGAIPSRAASATRAVTAIRTGSGGPPAWLHRAPRPAIVARGPPVGGRGGVGGGAGDAAGGPYYDDGALGQESQGQNGPSECLDDLEVISEHTAADGSFSCVPGELIADEGDDGGDESEDDEDDESDGDEGDESECDEGDESDDDEDDESDDDESDEDEGDDDEGYESHIGSSNLKRRRKTSTSASSPRKRETRQMIKIMKKMLETMQANSAIARKVMLGELTAESIKQVMRLTMECGAAEGSIEHFMATQLFFKAGYRDMFLTFSTNEARLGWLKRWCQEKKLYSLFGNM